MNGSNARTYELYLTNPVTKVDGPAMWQIGTDGGYLDQPVKIDPNIKPLTKLILMPGERADVIIDFAGQTPGTRLVLRNTAKNPYPNGVTPNGNTDGRVMQFRVVPLTDVDTSYNPASGTPLRTGNQAIVRLANPATGTLAAGVTVQKRRQLTLNEVMGMPQTVGGVAYPGGPLEVLVNNTKWSGESDRPYNDFKLIGTEYHSELPNEGETEVWEIVNLTADAHPIHLHLVQFQLMNRQAFDLAKYNAAYNAAFPTKAYQPGFGPPLDYRAANNPQSGGKDGGNPDVTKYLKGPSRPPAANEAGWKDTVIMYPGQVTRIVVRFAPTNTPTGESGTFPFDPNGGHGYVWHCHIVDHEDNEMMRPFSVQAKNVNREITDY